MRSLMCREVGTCCLAGLVCMSTALLFANTNNTAQTAAAGRAAVRPADSRTVWDGVYTLQQMKRGEATYRRACSYCHLADLKGGSIEAAPALVGPAFLFKWRDRPLTQLFLKMAETMPRPQIGGGPPPKVALEEYLDLIVYILMANGMPPGDAELPADERLERIFITEKPTR